MFLNVLDGMARQLLHLHRISKWAKDTGGGTGAFQSRVDQTTGQAPNLHVFQSALQTYRQPGDEWILR
jgi:hypothetical protein